MLRNITYYFIIIFAFAVAAHSLPSAATAGITWDGEFDEFRFAVQDNGGIFGYEPSEYLGPNSDEEECSYRPSQSQFDDYSCRAEGDLSEFGALPGDGELRLKAMAKGTGEAMSPPNGLKVQGYLETIPSNLNPFHALNTEQTVIAWASRKFSVDEEGEYTLKATLSGLVDFNEYNYNARDTATYSVTGDVVLEEIIDDTVFNTMPGFPQALDDVDTSSLMSVQLKTQTQTGQTVTYRLKITLRLESTIINFSLSPYLVYRAVDGNFQLGSESSPFVLRANLRPRGGNFSSLMNLLLSDE